MNTLDCLCLRRDLVMWPCMLPLENHSSIPFIILQVALIPKTSSHSWRWFEELLLIQQNLSGSFTIKRQLTPPKRRRKFSKKSGKHFNNPMLLANSTALKHSSRSSRESSDKNCWQERKRLRRKKSSSTWSLKYSMSTELLSRLLNYATQTRASYRRLSTEYTKTDTRREKTFLLSPKKAKKVQLWFLIETIFH